MHLLQQCIFIGNTTKFQYLGHRLSSANEQNE